jgi:hypothetical protein
MGGQIIMMQEPARRHGGCSFWSETSTITRKHYNNGSPEYLDSRACARPRDTMLCVLWRLHLHARKQVVGVEIAGDDDQRDGNDDALSSPS